MLCFLPFRGEFGWYLTSYVRMVHAHDSIKKIVCIKPGHECLFPSSTQFFYDWADIPDDHKAGVSIVDDEEIIKEKIKLQFPDENIRFISPSVITWLNRHTYHKCSFIPESINKLDLKVDVVITPRHRQIDVLRNWDCANWQMVVDALHKKGITVGICGTKETSCQLQNILHKSYDHIDIDSDVEMMNNAKLVVTQETGLQYLSFMCKRPTFCVGLYYKDHGADLYRDASVPFKELRDVVVNPMLLVSEIINFLESQK